MILYIISIYRTLTYVCHWKTWFGVSMAVAHDEENFLFQKQAEAKIIEYALLNSRILALLTLSSGLIMLILLYIIIGSSYENLVSKSTSEIFVCII